MADQKISQLDAIVEIDNAFDSLAIVDQSAAATKKVTPSQLQTALGVPLNTDELAEGSTNLYLTTERVQDIVGAEIQGSEDITATYSDALGTVTISLDTGIDAAKIADGTVSNAEFQYLNGVTSAIQTQVDAKLAKFDGSTYDINALACVTQAEYDALTPSSTTIYFIV